jgi:hypothetical protein
MKKRSRILHFLSASLLVLTMIDASPASAAEFRERRHRQQERIEQGMERGFLAPGEVRKLRREQKKIGHTAKRMRADDGKLDRRERKRLNRMQDRASRHIDRFVRNRRTGP